MANKKTVSINKNEESIINVDLTKIRLDATNEIADNIIDAMNVFFSLNKINIADFNQAEYKRFNYPEPIRAKELLSYILSTIPYFERYRIGFNTNSKGIINSIYLLDKETLIDVTEEYLI